MIMMKKRTHLQITLHPDSDSGSTIDEIKLNDSKSKLEGNRLILRKGESIRFQPKLYPEERQSNAEIKAEWTMER